ncbi:hypothetical protein [Streptomyces sediminimaris]|uniref:hypothetical protein n=1 Tax=Streptomyces sediminimaris TaxID=3383721 RepID=UPI00399AE500
MSAMILALVPAAVSGPAPGTPGGGGVLPMRIPIHLLESTAARPPARLPRPAR